MPAALLGSMLLLSSSCLEVTLAEGSSPIIQAIVNGAGPFAMVLDTASSGSTLDQTRIDQLGLERDIGQEKAEGLGGPTDVHLYKIASLKSGPVDLSNLVAPMIAAPEFESHDIAGLAGVDLFAQRMAVWRPGAGCVDVLDSHSDTPPGPGWIALPVQWLKDWKIMAPVRIGDIEGWGLLDTGAQHTVLNPVFARRLGGMARPGGRMSGIDGRDLALTEIDAPTLAIGAWEWANPSLKVGGLPVFDRLGEPDAPLAIIGMDRLADREFAIDYRTQRVWQRATSADAVTPPE